MWLYRILLLALLFGCGFKPLLKGVDSSAVEQNIHFEYDQKDIYSLYIVKHLKQSIRESGAKITDPLTINIKLQNNLEESVVSRNTGDAYLSKNRSTVHYILKRANQELVSGNAWVDSSYNNAVSEFANFQAQRFSLENNAADLADQVFYKILFYLDKK